MIFIFDRLSVEFGADQGYGQCMGRRNSHLQHTEMPESGFYIPSSFDGYGGQKVLFKLHSAVFGHTFECNSSLKLSVFDTQAFIKQAKCFLNHGLETDFSSPTLSPFRNSVQALNEQFLGEVSHST